MKYENLNQFNTGDKLTDVLLFSAAFGHADSIVREEAKKHFSEHNLRIDTLAQIILQIDYLNNLKAEFLQSVVDELNEMGYSVGSTKYNKIAQGTMVQYVRTQLTPDVVEENKLQVELTASKIILQIATDLFALR